MKIYKVGGAVRDELLGLPSNDNDWVVTGATPAQMVAAGYRQVGKDFPVFLHPETQEEYALARTERKTGPGYHGFVVNAAPNVTLEEDLSRRDLTINAMARDQANLLIDPCGGQADLENRVLRHVSSAFSEDPLRILRVARFAARFAGLGFELAKETCHLMAAMVQDGELLTLAAERVWVETERALAGPQPRVFFTVLRQCGALAVLYPELDQLFGHPQPEKFHSEIDTGEHTLRVLDQIVELSAEPDVRFAALVQDVGKGETIPDEWPRHIGHEQRSVEMIGALCQRLKLPKAYRELAVLVVRYHSHCHRVFELKPSALLKILESLDVFRRPQRFEQFLLCCEADARGSHGYESEAYPQAQYIYHAYEIVKAITAASLVAEGLSGLELAKQLRQQRIEALDILMKK